MQKNKRYEWDKMEGCEWIRDTEMVNQPLYYDLETVANLLNQQDKYIKELEESNEPLKKSKAHFKKVAENVVDLLGKLNKFIGEPQTQELNYCKVIEDTKNYIEELKQSQKQLAISKLEDVYQVVKDYNSEANKYEPYIDTLDIEQYIDDKIKELKGEK